MISHYCGGMKKMGLIFVNSRARIFLKLNIRTYVLSGNKEPGSTEMY